MRIIISSLMVFALCCQDHPNPRLDTTNTEVWTASLEKIENTMSKAEFKRLQDQANQVAFSLVSADELLSGIDDIHQFMRVYHGMTGPEILSYTDSVINGQQLDKEREEALAAQMLEKEKSDFDQMTKSLDVVVYEKGFYTADFQDYITMKLGFHNRSELEITAFKGMIEFKDLFGDHIRSVNLKYDEGIHPSSQIKWEASLDYNQFEDDDRLLKSKALDKMTIRWVPESIIFGSGLILGR